MKKAPLKISCAIGAATFILSLVAVAINVHGHGAEVHDHYGRKPYPLKKCLVSDDALDGHGKPYVFTYRRQEIKLCCKACLKTFKKEPPKYLAKLSPGQ